MLLVSPTRLPAGSRPMQALTRLFGVTPRFVLKVGEKPSGSHERTAQWGRIPMKVWSTHSLYKGEWFDSQQSLPFQQLQVLWTLFSECFSSFPCGTCSLSVSHLYLALGGAYHLFWTALSSNPTRQAKYPP